MQEPPKETPPVPPNPEGEGKSERADLSHFRPQAEKAGAPPPKKSVDISGALSSALQKGAQTKAKIAAAKPSPSFPVKKAAAAAAVLLVVVPLAAFLVFVLPGQMSRSGAFGAYEKGDFERAGRELRAYLADHPGDNEAAYYAARAAAKTGDFSFAAATMNRIASAAEFAEDPGFIFSHALILGPKAETVKILNKLVSVAPQHAGGRLMRGVLLTRENEFSRAREDFLEADSAIRDPDYDGKYLREVHRRIAGGKNVMAAFSAPSAPADSPAFQSFASRVGAPVPEGLFLNRYFPMPPPADAENYGDVDLVGFYYAAMLVLAKQFREAEVEFSKFPPAVAESAEVEILKAVRGAVQGKYREAADKFAELAKDDENFSGLPVNLANASFSANPSANTALSAAALYDKALAADDNPEPETLHNRALLRLINGDDAGAREDIAALKENAPGQTRLLRVLAELADNPQSGAIDGLLKSAGDFPGAVHIRAAHYAAAGKHNQALRLLGKSAGGGKWNGDARAYVRLLADTGLLMRSYQALRIRAPEQDAETRYRSGVLELASGNLPQAEETVKLMEAENGGHAYTDAMRGLVEHAKNNSEQALVYIGRAAEKAQTETERQNIAVDAADVLFAGSPRLLENILGALKSLDPKTEALRARLLAEKNPKDAAQKARAAAARYPVFAVQYHAGAALAAAGETEEAAGMLRNAAEWNPVNISLLAQIAELESAAGDSEAAEKTRQRIARIKQNAGKKKDNEINLAVDAPRDARMIKIFTNVLNKGAPPAPALARFEELLKDAPGAAETAVLRFQRATFYSAINQYGKAEEDLGAALPALSADLRRRALGYLGDALGRQKKYPEAADIYRRLAKEHPDSPIYRRLAGRAVSNYDAAEAVQYLTETAALYPADIETYFELSGAMQKAQRILEASAVLQKAVRIAPLHVKIYAMLSRTQRSHNPEAAKENSIIAAHLVS